MEQIDTLWLFPVPCISTEHCICLFKQLFADNGRNHILHDTPFRFIPFYQPFVIAKSNCFIAVLYQCPFVDGISYDCQHRCILPKIIPHVMHRLEIDSPFPLPLQAGRYFSLIQNPCNLRCTFPACRQCKDFPDHLGCRFIYNQFMLICRVFAVAKCGKGSCIFPLFVPVPAG